MVWMVLKTAIIVFILVFCDHTQLASLQQSIFNKKDLDYGYKWLNGL